jgi:hypothetical protein
MKKKDWTYATIADMSALWTHPRGLRSQQRKKFNVKMPIKATITKECGATVAINSLPRGVIVTTKMTKPLLDDDIKLVP